ncbi:hypothetical protein EZJ43_03625 [Pedobacter changchengzhani]|uniref:DUF3108 domain-containing protein n=1 Tax=Pedobacter changchengzhani TaxID=2529274 RepID=A0A4R5MN42_9SPHI|nr:hypothetical protein [Pedobacter changchengzhani]TDG37221.1 hypothetical protein EZJ43_03625 [Pedobacter changchengzhani]
MKEIKIFILSILLFSPVLCFAQKAYESVDYVGAFNGFSIKFTLANGYIGASRISLKINHKKALIFTSVSGVADEKEQLKFLHYINPLKFSKNYFILYGMRAGYADEPQRILGTYHDGKREFKIILKKK